MRKMAEYCDGLVAVGRADRRLNPFRQPLTVEVTAAESRPKQPICAALVVDRSFADEILMTPGQVKAA
ncbi:hypothetical protein ACH427_28120 [Streptomyces sp. NPDC020379]|uniref:hypothetical protein n=1 Tax=Streptomyces sp. NPDC020379 TaxID=3365071 RepID=UPI0037BAD909